MTPGRPLRPDREQPGRRCRSPAHGDRVLRPRGGRRAGRSSCFGVPPRPAARRRGLGNRGDPPARHPQLDPCRRALALQLAHPRRARADDRRAAAGVVPCARSRGRRDRQGRRRGRRRGGLRGRARGGRPHARAARHRARAYRPRRVLRRSRTTSPAARPSRRPRRAGCSSAGVRVMGIDAWGWDGPLHFQAEAAAQADAPGSVLGGAPGRPAVLADRAPRSTWPSSRRPGFQLACFPLKIVGASAAPARVVAIVPGLTSCPAAPVPVRYRRNG